MQRTNKYIFILILTLIPLLQSCFKEDTAVVAYPKGNFLYDSVNIGLDYEQQIYYSLSQHKIIKQNLFSIWDLGFECEKDKFRIITNPSRLMGVANLGNIKFDSSLSADNLNYKNDHGGSLDSTAFGIWWNVKSNNIISQNNTYIIDRGTAAKNETRFKKLRILDFTNNHYSIELAELDGKNYYKINIEKNPQINFATISLDKGQLIDIEPPTADWDCLFTRFPEFFAVLNYIPYSVTGMLTNPKRIKAAADSVGTFDNITIDKISKYTMLSRDNVIGWDWKEYKFNSTIYNVKNYKNYIILDDIGYYYKLRFYDFYQLVNGKEEKGHPKFEYTKLK